jgi:hypothetical protein
MRTIIICTKDLDEFKEWAALGCFDKRATSYVRIIGVSEDAQIVFWYGQLVKDCNYLHNVDGEVILLYHFSLPQIPILLNKINVQFPAFQVSCGSDQKDSRTKYKDLQAALATDQLAKVFDDVWFFFLKFRIKAAMHNFLNELEQGSVFDTIPELIRTPELEVHFEPFRNQIYNNSNETHRTALEKLTTVLFKSTPRDKK